MTDKQPPPARRPAPEAPGLAFLLVLAAGYLAMLVLNWPGHLSYDSVIALAEGRFRQRLTWAPAFFPWLLGLFDRLSAGTGLYLAASGLLLFGSLASLARLAPARTSWLAAPAAALACLAPQLLLYQGVVWKDVLFANLAIASLVALAHAARDWRVARRRWAGLFAWLLLAASAALVRQNGLIVGLCGGVAIAWIAAQGKRARGLAYGAAALVALAAGVLVIGAYATPDRGHKDQGAGVGLRILQTYDLMGVLARHPSAPLPAIEARNPRAAAAMRAEAAAYYSPERIDVLDSSPRLAAELVKVEADTLAAEWRALVVRRPGLYLEQRLDVFRWVFLTPRIDRCVPTFVGVSGPADQLRRLGLREGFDRNDARLGVYSNRLAATPVYSHLAFAVAGALALAFLLWRRRPCDIAIAGLILAGAGFAASFFVISIACDYRYLYFLDLAAITAVIHIAIDPRGRSRRDPGQ